MKTKIISFVIFGILLFTSISFDVVNCESYYPTKKGFKASSTEYDDKNNIISKTTIEVVEVNNSGNKTIAVINSETTDLKKNKTTSSSYDIECDNFNTEINSIKSIEANLKKSTQMSSSTATGNNPVFPNNLSVGQTLPDSNIHMSIKGEISLESYVKLFERKVVGMESVTVDAGTFQCAVITYKEDTKILFDKVKSHKVWMAKGIGIVKAETYNKKGKLESTSKLTSLKK